MPTPTVSDPVSLKDSNGAWSTGLTAQLKDHRIPMRIKPYLKLSLRSAGQARTKPFYAFDNQGVVAVTASKNASGRVDLHIGGVPLGFSLRSNQSIPGGSYTLRSVNTSKRKVFIPAAHLDESMKQALSNDFFMIPNVDENRGNHRALRLFEPGPTTVHTQDPPPEYDPPPSYEQSQGLATNSLGNIQGQVNQIRSR